MLDLTTLRRYHPHIHEIAFHQVQGGATGVIVIEGLENIQPKVAGLPEYIMVSPFDDQPSRGPV